MKKSVLQSLRYLSLASVFVFSAGSLYADAIPSGWTCVGTCGSLGSDGVVTLSPTGNSSYQYVSTTNGTIGVGSLPSGSLGSETNGSTLATTVFSATAGTALNFYFNFVTSDGAGFADYAWAELYDSANNPVSLLFTARTLSSGTIVPGFGMPAPNATLTPASVPIIANQTTWSPLGLSSGSCYSAGCGNTGWINSNYIIGTSGNYYLKVGVTNWLDTAYDTGLALDGVAVGGVPITPPTGPSAVPEPSTIALFGTGIVGLIGAARRRFLQNS